MKDAQGNLVQGRTRWRLFAAAIIPATVVTGVVMAGMANGAIAAQFSVSGQTFKVSADKLEATGFVQYGGLASPKGADPKNPLDPRNHAVARAGMKDATLTNLCQSIKVPGLPVSLVINAGAPPGEAAHATDLWIDMTDLTGSAKFTDINIGQDASTLDGVGPDAQAGGFGQGARTVVITGLKQTAWATSAGEFELKGMHLFVDVNTAKEGPKQCF